MGWVYTVGTYMDVLREEMKMSLGGKREVALRGRRG